MPFQLAYLHPHLASFKGQDQGHAQFECEYLANVGYLTNVTIAMKTELLMLIRFAYPHFTLATSNSQVTFTYIAAEIIS